MSPFHDNDLPATHGHGQLEAGGALGPGQAVEGAVLAALNHIVLHISLGPELKNILIPSARLTVPPVAITILL